MKRRGFSRLIRPGGILFWSTACILTGGLASCDRSVTHVISEKDAEMAETELKIEKLDSEKSVLQQGEVSHNFHIDKVGYYHADARDFFPHPHGFEQDGRYYANGVWSEHPVLATLERSKPTPEALAKVEKALEEEQTAAAPSSHGHGFGMGNALMMYWLLSGSRGSFFPGAGFRRADTQAADWQRGVDRQRDVVRGYAAANPGYRRMVDQSRASGMAVRPGQTVRGGFGSTPSSRSEGSSSRSSGFSFGS